MSPGKVTHTAGIDNGAGHPTLPQREEGHLLNAATGFHRHQRRAAGLDKSGQPANPFRGNFKAFKMAGCNEAVQPVFGGIDTTIILHDNVPVLFVRLRIKRLFGRK